MIRAFNHRGVPRIATSLFVVLLLLPALVASHAAHAGSAAAAAAPAVTTKAVTYRLSGQTTSGPLAGWLSGSLDSTGILTATVTMADAVTNAPITEDVSGHITGKGTGAQALFAVSPQPKGLGAPWTLAGGPMGTTGSWSGTLSQGSTYAGLWVLTPQTSHVSLNFGGKSAASSKDKVSVSGLVSAGVTADGWADGTYSSFDGTVTTVVHGWVNSGGDVQFTIPWGKKGTVVLVGLQGKVLLTHPSWSGTFIGPGVGDSGTWIAQS